MALSFYPNWEELMMMQEEGHHFNSEISFFNPSLSPDQLLLGFDSVKNDYGFPETSCSSLHDPFTMESQEMLLPEPYPYLKRQKGHETESFSSEIIIPAAAGGLHQCINGFSIIPSPSFFQDPFPDFASSSSSSSRNPPLVRSKPVEGKKKSGTRSGSGSGGSLSAQSMAARERRRKITEKTQELGKLIPATSQKMNTAEMFEAAFKYIKFLQAQVGILEAMSSSVHQVIIISFFFFFLTLNSPMFLI